MRAPSRRLGKTDPCLRTHPRIFQQEATEITEEKNKPHCVYLPLCFLCLLLFKNRPIPSNKNFSYLCGRSALCVRSPVFSLDQQKSELLPEVVFSHRVR